MLEVAHVDKRFPPRRRAQGQAVLRDVSLRVDRRELVALIGHSGCGKSTLLNVVAGLARPDSGEVMFDGLPVTGPGPDRAVVFQQYSLLPYLNLLENVRRPARHARPDRAALDSDATAERCLRAVGLWDHRHKRPAEISGGMQQRVAVARAFAVEPGLLLLDEPFGALDSLTRARLQDELIHLWQEESKTEAVLMVTHDIDEAILLADRIVVMGPPPGPSILEEVPVPFARPRDSVEIVKDPLYRPVRDRVTGLLAAKAA